MKTPSISSKLEYASQYMQVFFLNVYSILHTRFSFSMFVPMPVWSFFILLVKLPSPNIAKLRKYVIRFLYNLLYFLYFIF